MYGAAFYQYVVFLVLCLLVGPAVPDQIFSWSTCPGRPLHDLGKLSSSWEVSGHCSVHGPVNVWSKVSCPPGKPAIVIRGGNVSISNVEFSGCIDVPSIILVECSRCKVRLINVSFIENAPQRLLHVANTVSLNVATFNQTVLRRRLEGYNTSREFSEVEDISGGGLIRLSLTGVEIRNNQLGESVISMTRTALKMRGLSISNNSVASLKSRGERTLLMANESSMSVNDVKITANTGWDYLLHLQTPLGSSALSRTLIEANQAGTLIRFDPHMIFTNYSKYNETFKRVHEDKDPEDEDYKVRMEHYEREVREIEELPFTYWSAPLRIFDSDIVNNTVNFSIIFATGKRDNGGFVMIESSRLLTNKVGVTNAPTGPEPGTPGGDLTTGTQKGVGSHRVHPPAVIQSHHAEIWIRKNVTVSQNEVNGHLIDGSSSQLLLLDSSLEGNKVLGDGLLLNWWSGSLKMNRMIWEGNRGDRGLIEIGEVNCIVNSSVFNNNSVFKTDQVSLVRIRKTKPTEITNCRFEHNSVNKGSILELTEVNIPKLVNNNFTYNIGCPLLITTVFHNFRGQELGINNSRFDHNQLTVVERGDLRVAALSVTVNSWVDLNFRNLIFTNNTLPQDKLLESSDSLNILPSLRGGAMMVRYGDEEAWWPFNISDVHFINNSIPGSGGGLWVGGVRGLNLTSCSFLNNSAGVQGGGLYVESAYLTMTDVVFENNTAETGGALVANPLRSDPCPRYDNEACVGGWVNVMNSTFHRNTARAQVREAGPGQALWDTGAFACSPGGGGAICVHPSNYFKMTGVELTENVAKWGGALFIHDSCLHRSRKSDERRPFQKCGKKPNLQYNFTLVGNMIDRNVAVNGTGAAIFATDINRLQVDCGGEVDHDQHVCASWRGNRNGVHRGNVSTVLGDPSFEASMAEETRPESCFGVKHWSKCGIIGSMPSHINATMAKSPYDRRGGDHGQLVLPDNITLSYWVTLYDKYGYQFEDPPSTTNVHLLVRPQGSNMSKDFVERPYIGGHLNLAIRVTLMAKTAMPTELVIQGFDQDLILPRKLVSLNNNQVEVFSTIVRPCIIGEGREGEGCLVCARGLFSSFPTVRCEPCPEHGDCTSPTGVMVPMEDYWHSSPYSPRLLSCPLRQACRGDRASLSRYISDHSEELMKMDVPEFNMSLVRTYRDDLQCAKGYWGNLCSGCAKNHGRVGHQCLPCPPLWRNLLYGVLVFLFLCGQVVLMTVNHTKSVGQKVFCPRVGLETKQARRASQRLFLSENASQSEESDREDLHPAAPHKPASSGSRSSDSSEQYIVVQVDDRVEDAGPVHRASRPIDYLAAHQATSNEEERVALNTSQNSEGSWSGGLRSPVLKRGRESTVTEDAGASGVPLCHISRPSRSTAAFMASAVLKILVNYVQILSIIPHLKLTWPEHLRTFLQASSFSAPSEWISLQCLASGSEGRQEVVRAVLVVMLPLMLAVVAAVAWTSIWLIQSVLDNRRPAPPGQSRPPLLPCRAFVTPRLVATIIQACFLVYPMVTGVVMEIFPCDRIDTTEGLMDAYTKTVPLVNGTQAIWEGLQPNLSGADAVGPPSYHTPSYFWTRNFNIKCEAGHAQRILRNYVGFPGLVLFVVGFPLATIFIVHKNARAKKLHKPEVALKYGFLYEAYQEKYSYWENLILLRKGMLLTASIFLAPMGPSVQLPTCIVLMLISVVGQEAVQPFAVPLLNRLERNSLFVITLNFVLMAYLSGEHVSNGIRVAIFAIVVLTTLAVFGELLYFLGKAVWSWARVYIKGIRTRGQWKHLGRRGLRRGRGPG